MLKLHVLVGGSGLAMEWLIWCNELTKREDESRPALSKVEGAVDAANGSRDSTLYRYNGQGIYYGQDECTKKKNCEGFPMFFTLKNSKAPFWATWNSGGVVISIVVVFIAVAIVVVDLVSKERGTMQKANVSNGMQKMNLTWEGEITVRSFARSIVRSFVVVE
jgi:hypothetical protein